MNELLTSSCLPRGKRTWELAGFTWFYPGLLLKSCPILPSPLLPSSLFNASSIFVSVKAKPEQIVLSGAKMMRAMPPFVGAAWGSLREHSTHQLAPPLPPPFLGGGVRHSCLVFPEDYFPLGSASKAAELFTQSTVFLQTWDKMQLSFAISGHNDG